MRHPYFAGTRHPRVLAHRGLIPTTREDSPVWENSAAAFAAAHASGAEYIETDCRLTVDGDVVLVHDETLIRLAGDARATATVRTAELRTLFEDHGGLLTVAEALELFPDTRFNIDVKTDAAAEPAGRLVAPHTERVLLTSFSDRRRRTAVEAALRAGAALRPATSGGRRTIMALRAASSMRLSPGRILADLDAVQIPERYNGVRVLTPALLRAAHSRDVEVHVWTVNEPDDIRRLVAMGVDGIVSDRADVAVSLLHRD
ncbi:glycerophosphodiester phosphodiesterase family protein [Microbacterium sp.]|uniref:glycerophosphodiester phosphodiesterase family protein n=1 Tax=Microbacterium sp. TaxID=51671 RepID=UPI0028118818|nr:glycerophosphodiester phosphodiesterase family protein [Microbacterium sp.]